MTVLGIDPGTAACGYGIVHGSGGRLRAVCHGWWRTSPAARPEARLRTIFDGVTALIEEHRPAAVALEESYVGADARTALSVGQARGAVLVASARAGVACTEYAPASIKQAVCGYGRADKAQVGRMVSVILQLAEVPHPDDTADALATAVCIANAERPGMRVNTGNGKAGVLDRAAVDPITRGETPYERAVREALSAETRTLASGRPAPAARKTR